MAKVGALVGSDKPKDAHDIVRLFGSVAPGGPKGAAAVVQESIAFERADVEAALVRLAVEFGDVALLGPRAFARLTAPSDVR